MNDSQGPCETLPRSLSLLKLHKHSLTRSIPFVILTCTVFYHMLVNLHS